MEEMDTSNMDTSNMDTSNTSINGTNGTTDAIKEEPIEIFPVKEEPEEDIGDQEEGAGDGKRRVRKVKKPNFAELSDSGEDDEIVKPPPKKRQSTGRGRGRGAKRGVPAGMSPTVMLENIEGSTPPTKRGRGRGRGTPKSGGRGRGKAKQPVEQPPESDEASSDNAQDLPEESDDADITEESEDEWAGEKKKKSTPVGRGRGRGGRGRGGGRGGKKASPPEDRDEEEDEDADMPPMSDATVNDLSGPVRTGQFMIENNDTKHLENYPIWRMEGPNMLRKFEMVVSGGKIRHRSLYAYSSWAQTMVDLYTRIQVQQLSSSDGEIVVEVKPDYVPQPPALESLQSQYAEDELLPPFKIFIEALFRQNLDTSFLVGVREKPDPHYLDPISTFDTLCADAVKKIESEVNMKEEFMTRVKSCPNMKGIKRQNWSQTDQATVDKVTEKGVRSVLMFGYGYDAFFMTEDSSRGVEVAQEIIIGSTMEKYLKSYHGLTHFKYHSLMRCQHKARLEKGLNPELPDDDILSRCLNDEVWILGSFDDLRSLLKW